MIVYASRIELTDRDPRASITGALCDWLSHKLRRNVTPDSLRADQGEFGHGHHLQVEEFDGSAEWSIAWRYSHPDAELDGRTWITEVGVTSDAGRSRCTVLLHTEEQSALVHHRPDTTRPWIVTGIEQACSLHRSTPGGAVKTLCLEDSDAFLSVARDPDRSYPIVQISHDQDGRMLLDGSRMAGLSLGIALVAVIPQDVDTFALEHEVGRALCSFGGAINILWPAVRRQGSAFVPTTRLYAEDLLDFAERGLSPERECLARICHYTNPGLARSHVSPERVRAQRLQRAIEQARAERGSGADPGLVAMIDEIDREQRDEIKALGQKISGLERELKAVQEERDEAQRKAAALADHLNARSAEEPAGGVADELRDCILRTVGTDPHLEDCLSLLTQLFPERLVVLPSAWQSAREASGFRRTGKAFELLRSLCTGYYDAMVDGQGDKLAGQVFGPNSYAARESETVEGNKRARALRTFVYQSQPIEMVRHLKIGVKDSIAETFRAHFHWDAAEQKVVLGHCGRHLDHG